jgi:hypothetical protein
LRWKNSRSELALSAAEEGDAANKLKADQWDLWFARYVSKQPDLAALWGFLVIDIDHTLTPNSHRFDSYMKARIDSDWSEKLAKPMFFKTPAQVERVRIESAQQDWRHGPWPEFGYQNFMENVGYQSAQRLIVTSPRLRSGIP